MPSDGESASCSPRRRNDSCVCFEDTSRADKAYSCRATRNELRRRGIKAVIPEPSDQAGRKRRGSGGGRPISYDATEYEGRNVIERGFNVLKQGRALATRYDKHALTYCGALVLVAILTWLR